MIQRDFRIERAGICMRCEGFVHTAINTQIIANFFRLLEKNLTTLTVKTVLPDIHNSYSPRTIESLLGMSSWRRGRNNKRDLPGYCRADSTCPCRKTDYDNRISPVRHTSPLRPKAYKIDLVKPQRNFDTVRSIRLPYLTRADTASLAIVATPISRRNVV